MSVRAFTYLSVLLLACVASAQTWASPAMNALTELRAASAAVPDARRGDEIFATCAACHGVDGSGLPDGSVPVIGSQYYQCCFDSLSIIAMRSVGISAWNMSHD